MPQALGRRGCAAPTRSKEIAAPGHYGTGSPAEGERATWQALWRDVDELAKRLAKQEEPTKGHKDSETPKAKPEGRSAPPSGATAKSRVLKPVAPGS
jgi:hypothetical protein